MVDAEQDFEWGVWTSLSRDNFARTLDIWEREGRESEQTMVQTRPLGLRPLVELEPTDHPLAVEQREGITVARVQSIAEQLLHAD